jgi:hypothetical protein
MSEIVQFWFIRKFWTTNPHTINTIWNLAKIMLSQSFLFWVKGTVVCCHQLLTLSKHLSWNIVLLKLVFSPSPVRVHMLSVRHSHDTWRYIICHCSFALWSVVAKLLANAWRISSHHRIYVGDNCEI